MDTVWVIGSILCCWALALAAVVGLGLWVGRLRAFRGMELSVARAGWLGLVFAVGGLQIVHFWMAIQGVVSGVLLAVGVAGIVVERKRLRERFRARPLGMGQVFTCVLAAIWLAEISTASRRDVDTVLYHLQAVRWTQAYPVVVGLGNLQGRMAFNSVAELVFAGLGVGPWRANPMEVGNGFFLLLLVISGARYIGGEGRVGGWRAMRWFWSVFLPAMAIWAYAMPGSLWTDLMPFALLAAATGAAVEFLLEEMPADAAAGTMGTVGLLAITAITAKISSAGYAGAMLVMCMWLAGRERRRVAGILAAGIALLVIPWVARNVMMSGCLVYPVAATRLSVAWAVPVEMIRWEAYAIHTWAVWDNWPPEGAGFRMWAGHVVRMNVYEYYVISLPLLIGVIFWMKGRGEMARRMRWLLLPLAVGVVYWICTAPTVRFLGPEMWLFAAIGAAGYAAARGQVRVWPVLGGMIVISLVIGMGTSWTVLHGKPLRVLAGNLLRAEMWEGDRWAEIHPAVREVKTRSGLVVYVPAEGATEPPLELRPYVHGKVGDAPLPASPYVHPGLRLRVAGDLGSGFEIDSGE